MDSASEPKPRNPKSGDSAVGKKTRCMHEALRGCDSRLRGITVTTAVLFKIWRWKSKRTIRTNDARMHAQIRVFLVPSYVKGQKHAQGGFSIPMGGGAYEEGYCHG
jgi:hypothetical protein